MQRISLVVIALFISFAALAQEKDLWQDLKDGNDRYVDGKLVYDNLKKQREDVVKEQEPPVVVLSCADSRVPPELMFDQSVGDLFVVRTAGNVADSFGVASIEYAALHPTWPKLIVVIGHQGCGAVKEAVKQENPPSPSLLALVDRIRASFYGLTTCDPKKDLDCAIRANAKAAAKALLSSEIIRKRTDIRIVTAYYSLESGRVTLIE